MEVDITHRNEICCLVMRIPSLDPVSVRLINVIKCMIYACDP